MPDNPQAYPCLDSSGDGLSMRDPRHQARAAISVIAPALAERDGVIAAKDRALVDVAAHLAAAISLLERGGKAAKKAAPSDKMFDQMLTDYRNSLERARAILTRSDDNG